MASLKEEGNMKICGSERCGQVMGLGCFVASATLVALAVLYASSVIKGVGAYKVAVGCGVSATMMAIVGAILFFKKLPCTESEAFMQWG